MSGWRLVSSCQCPSEAEDRLFSDAAVMVHVVDDHHLQQGARSAGTETLYCNECVLQRAANERLFGWVYFCPLLIAPLRALGLSFSLVFRLQKV